MATRTSYLFCCNFRWICVSWRCIAIGCIGTLFAHTCLAELPHCLQLNDGSSGRGKIISFSDDNTLTWLNEGFDRPFEFPMQTIRSIFPAGEFARLSTKPATVSLRRTSFNIWMIRLQNGNQFVGTLNAVTEDFIEVDTEPLERVRVPRSQVKSIIRYMESVLNSFSNEPIEWNTTGPSPDWTLTKSGLSTKVRNAAIEGAVHIPGPIEVRLRLRWEGAANFSISIGERHAVAALNLRHQERQRDNRIVRNAARSGYAVTLDAWADKLFLVGEERKVLSVAPTGILGAEAGYLDAVLRLDPSLGTAELQTSGQPPLRLTCQASTVRPSVEKILITNMGDLLSVDFVALRRWDRVLETIETTAKPQVILIDRSTISGRIRTWDTQTGDLELETPDGTQILPARELLAGRLARMPSGSPPMSDASAEAQATDSQRLTNSEPADEFTFTLIDEGRISGRILSGDGENLVVKILGIDKEATLAVQHIAGMTPFHSQKNTKSASSNSAGEIREQMDRSGVSDSDLNPPEDFADPQKKAQQSGVEGIAFMGMSQIEGNLLAESPEGSGSALYWQPTSSLNSSPLRTDAKGEIRFSDRSSQTDASKLADSEALGTSHLLKLSTSGGLSAFEGPGYRVDKSPKSEFTRIEFTTGDILPAVITAMDQHGVNFESPNSKLTVAHNHQLHRVTFTSAPFELVMTEEQRGRLLKIPRNLRDDPPTHLIVSTTGDVLRGNVLALVDGNVVAEIRGTTARLPTRVISEIIWLHPPSHVKQSPTSEDQIRILTKEQSTATLRPLRVTGGELIGTNEIFGELRMSIDQLQKISFGQQVTLREFLLYSESDPPEVP